MGKDNSQRQATFAIIKKAASFFRESIRCGQMVDEAMAADLQRVAENFAREIGCSAPKRRDLSDNCELEIWIGEIGQLEEAAAALLPQASQGILPWDDGNLKGNNRADAAFYGIMDEIAEKPVSSLVEQAKKAFRMLPGNIQQKITYYLEKYPYWGGMDPQKGDYSLLANHAEALIGHREDFLWLYGRLGDYRSKHTLLAILQNWMRFETEGLEKTKEILYGDYFDLDIFPYGKDEVFVDLGAYTGDTALEYMKLYGGCKKMYCYEITEDSFQKLVKNTAHYAQIECRKKGVASQAGEMYVTAFSTDASANVLKAKGEAKGKEAVPVVALDEDIQEPVTFIKMDIEGSEQAALQGAAGHIRRSHPKLAICTYHNNEDIWKIPRMIDEIQPGYRFYMRHNGGNLTPSEYVLLAVWQGEA